MRLDELDKRIEQQIVAAQHQVRDALAAAEKLTVAEQARVEERIKGVELVAQITQQNAESASRKTERDINTRLEGQNEWRAQSADRERTQQEAIAQLTQTLLPRETYETALEQWNVWRAQVDSDRARLQGVSAGAENTHADLYRALAAAVSVVGVVIVAVTILVR